MDDFLRLIGVVVLLAAVSWTALQWIGWVGDLYTAMAVWIPGCLLLAFLIDRRQQRRARSQASRSSGTGSEN